MSAPLTPEEFIAVTRREAGQRFGHRAGEILAQVPEAGAPRSAIWRRLSEEWRKNASSILSQAINYTQGSFDHTWRMEACRVYTACADDLDTALRACAEVPATDTDDDNDLRDVVEIAANSLHDVVALGRFSPAVDPARWCHNLEQHLRAALETRKD